MLIREVTDVNYQKLVALGQFLIGRAGDTDSKKTISVDAFVNMARNMGINITADQLRDLATQDPLKNTIVNVTDDEIIFTGAGEAGEMSDTMTVDQAQDTVAKMAKNALPNDLK
jgi:hypothetical protein